MILIERFRSFFWRACWLSKLMNGIFFAVLHIVRVRVNSEAKGVADYKEFRIEFRKSDMMALKEVLVDLEYEFLTAELAKLNAPVIVDLGAHIGTFAIWVFSVNSRAKILSIEADSDTFSVLSRNKSHDLCNDLNWMIENRAAWRNDDILTLSNEGDSMSHRVIDGGIVSVKGISFNDIYAKIPGGVIDIVKVDIEGAEEAFLYENHHVLKNVRILVIELHPSLCDIDLVYNILKQYYTVIENIGGRKSNKPLYYCRNL